MGEPKGDGSSSGGYEKIELPKEPAPSNETVLGIDCAHYQAGIQWNKVVAEGVKFCINKATDGATGRDSFYRTHTRDAISAGLIVGAYCFGRFKADPTAQAVHLVNTAGSVNTLCLDVEWDNSSGGFPKYRNGGEMDDFAADHAFACLQEIERLTKRVPWIYTAPGFWTGKFKNPERFAKYPLWLNDFRAKDVSQLRIPKPWKRATVWQFGEKPMAGVGGVDLNRFLGSLEQLKELTK